MNWNAIGALAELTGAAAVVVSLVYLASQIRQGSRQARVASRENMSSALRSFSQPLAQDEALNLLWNKGLEDPDDLGPAELSRFLHLATQFGKLFESAHGHYVHGIMDEGTWAGWREVSRHYFHAPGWQRYWAGRRAIYSPSFQEFIDTLPAPAERLTSGRLEPLRGGSGAPAT